MVEKPTAQNRCRGYPLLGVSSAGAISPGYWTTTTTTTGFNALDYFLGGLGGVYEGPTSLGPPAAPPQTQAPQQVQKYNQCVQQAKSQEHWSLAGADALTAGGIVVVAGSVYVTTAAIAGGVFETGGSFFEALETGTDMIPRFSLVMLAHAIPYVGGVMARTQAMDAYDRAVANCQTQTGVYLPTGD